MPQLEGRLPRVPAKEGLMPRLVEVRRAGWAVLCVAALVGSLCVVAVSPAGAVEGVADAAGDYDGACSGAAAADGGFGDVSSDHAHRAAIDCLAHYEITLGTGEGEFSPGASVTRRQMALFMARAAGVAGVVFDDAVDQGFTDVGSESQAIQDAINQVAAAGILTGSGGLFRPGDAVTRGEMAVAVINLLAQDGVSDFVERNSNGSITIKALALEDPDDPTSAMVPTNVRVDDVFADVRNTQIRAVDDAVSRLFELGIAKGTSAGVFSPDAEVTRGQMAAFITRALAFTSARPVGVSIIPGVAANTYDVVVLDENFEPVVDARVDYFFMLGDTSGAFNADGTCDTRVVESNPDDDPTTECQIDSGDAVTGGRGEVTLTVSGVTPTVDDPLTVWVWTGDVGDEVQQGTELATYVATTAASDVIPEGFTLKRSSPTQVARMGSIVTVTLQLVDNNTDYNSVSQAGHDFRVGIEVRKGIDTATGLLPVYTKRTISVTTDESGQATFTVGGALDSANDPDPNADDPDLSLELDVDYVPSSGSSVMITGDIFNTDRFHDNVYFADEPGGTLLDPEGKQNIVWNGSITAESVTPFNRASDAGDGATAYIDVTVLDLYGDPVVGQAVQLSDPSTDPDLGVTEDQLGTGTRPASRYTGRSGTVRLSYTRDSADAVQGTIRAQAADEEGALLTGVGTQSEAVTAIWVSDPDADEAEESESGNAYTILAVDSTSNAVVVDSDTNDSDTVVIPWVLSFDSDDQFVIADDGPTDLAGFVKAITDDLEEDDKPTLQWEFRSATKNNRVLWTLTIP